MKAEPKELGRESEGFLEPKSQLLLFSLGVEYFALDMSPVEGVLPNDGAISVPRQPIFLEGFYVHEGECLPLINLHRLLGVEPSEDDAGRRLILLRFAGFPLFMRVDNVIGTREIDPSILEDKVVLHQATAIEVEGRNYMLLNLDTLLESGRGDTPLEFGGRG